MVSSRERRPRHCRAWTQVRGLLADRLHSSLLTRCRAPSTSWPQALPSSLSASLPDRQTPITPTAITKRNTSRGPNSVEEAPTSELRSFLESYQSTFKTLPVSDASFRGYDAANIIIEGIRRAGTTDGTAVRDAIGSIEGLKGLAGVFNYVGGKGEGIDNVRLFTITVGRFSPAEADR
jgi:ABC-type branched-subunit amino acid transport system substrate-binding protein